MKQFFIFILTLFAGIAASAQTIRQQRIPTAYDFVNNISFSKPPQISNDTISAAPNRSLAVIGDKIFVKDSVWKEIVGTGEAGPQGPQGLQGPAGAAGIDGSIWYEAAGLPSPALGNNGDYYLNRSNGYYYNKVSGAWAIRGSLTGAQGIKGDKGDAGTPGANGAKGDKGDPGTSITIKGSYATSAELPGSGSIGDGYIVGDSLWIWDNISAEWDNVGLIRGPQGDAGPSGIAGAKWYDQSGTPASALGAIGDFFINRTTGDYYEKTGASTWTPRGSIKGPQGAQGIQGATGAAGAAGTAGTPGTPGAKWFDQAGAPSNATGIVGDFYINRSSGDYYEKTGTSVWTLRGNMKGPQGSSSPGGGIIFDNF